MPRINREQEASYEKKYSLNELLEVRRQIDKAGSEENWYLQKGAISISKRKGYEGAIMVKTMVDHTGKTLRPLLATLQEQVQQLRDKEDEVGKLNIYDSGK